MPDLPQNQKPVRPPIPSLPGSEKKPGLRTMKSDLEALTKNAIRPPILTTTSENLEAKTKTPGGTTLTINSLEKPKTDRPTKRAITIISAGAFLLLLLTAGLFFYAREETVKIPEVATPPPRVMQAPIFFATEANVTLRLKPQDRQGFLAALKQASSEPGRSGTVKRLTIKLLDGPQERLLTLADFLEILQAVPPPQLLENMDPYISLFIFYTEKEGRLGFAAKARDGNRALRDLYSWEDTLISSFKPLFGDAEQNIELGVFQDRIYKNIDWRFADVSTMEDLGIGYTIFPAKNVLILTTGKEALENAINRLLNEG